jgi:hypothetical protein
MVLPYFEYTKSQRQKLIDKMKSELKTIPSSNPMVNHPIPTKGSFEISAAYVKDLEEKYHHNILFTANLPSCVSEDDLRILFRPFVSDSKTEYMRKYQNKIISERYPFVKIINDPIKGRRMARIEFDPATRDAQFALLMRKVTKWVPRNKKNLNSNSSSIITKGKYYIDSELFDDDDEKRNKNQFSLIFFCHCLK